MNHQLEPRETALDHKILTIVDLVDIIRPHYKLHEHIFLLLYGTSMKNYLSILLLTYSFSGFTASEHAIWMQPESTLNQYHLHVSPQAMIHSNGTNEPTYGLDKIKSEEENDEHTRYNLTYKGIPIWGHQVIIHKKNLKKSLLTGVLVNEVEQDIPDNQHIMTAEEATKRILASIATPIKAKETLRIIFIDENKIAHNAWLLSFYTQDGDKGILNPHYIIDATNASILNQWDEAKTLIKGEGPGGNAIALPYRNGGFQYGKSMDGLPSLGKFPMEKWAIWCYMQTPDYRIINLQNGWLSESDINYVFPIYDEEETKYHLNADYSFCWPWTTLFHNENDNGYSPVNEAYSPNNDSMYFVNETLDMYRSFGVEYPIGKNDLPIRVYTHINGFDNAFSLPTFYVEGTNKIKAHQQIVLSNGVSYFTALTQSVLAHELSHNFTRLNSNLAYTAQSGGINESFSDMAAITLMDRIRNKHDFYWDGEDWSLGREATKSGLPLRYFEHPALDGHSIEHASDYTKKLKVHYSSGVFNRAFYLLAHQPGWSISDAFQVMVDANKNYWVPGTTFDQAACGVIQAAKDRKLNPDAVADSFEQVGVTCS